jgi:ribosome biogenesis protein NSA1
MSCLTADETGLLKVWDIKRSSGAVLKTTYGAQGRTRGIAALAWQDGTTSRALLNMQDNTISVYDLKDNMMLSCVKREGVLAATAYGMQVVRDRLFVVGKDGRIAVTTYEDSSDADQEGAKVHFMPSTGIVEAAQIQRRFGLIATGGKDNNLKVWSTNTERWDTPIFEAKNVRDHVLDVPYPVHIVGACVVDPHVFGVATAYHDVRFYDRRLSERPVQEFRIDREISRRPTALMQWNCNKFLVSEASGDIHLYDTRRGFASRAKLRGGVGSVRHMVKHPGGAQLLAANGLDRKTRIYHVPTGKLLTSIYIKQKGTAVLLDRNLPFVDNTASYMDVPNIKRPNERHVVPERLWDEMDPVNDEFEDDGTASTGTPSPATPTSGSAKARKQVTPSPLPRVGAASGAGGASAAALGNDATGAVMPSAAKRTRSSDAAAKDAAKAKPRSSTKTA